MQINGWRAPDYNHIDLTQQIAQQFSRPEGGSIDQSFHYIDPYGASEWYSICRQSHYLSMFDNLPVDWPDWLAKIVLHHIKQTSFHPGKVDVVGLGVGDGQKETLVCSGLYRASAWQRLRCFLVDLSPALLTEAHTHFVDTFTDKRNVESKWILGDFHQLPKYKELFADPVDAHVIRIATMFGETLANLRNERDFIQHSLKAFKPGDLLIVDVALGFAPHDRPDLIQKADPFFQSTTVKDWMIRSLKRNRPGVREIQLEMLVKHGLSAFPNAYTIEIQATADQRSVFSLLQQHRYVADDFVKTFMSLGWRPLEGRQYGYLKRQLIYIFAKK